MNTVVTDVLIIGSGAAGLSLSLRLADHMAVAVLAKNTLTEGSTYYAQGGISAVMSEEDSLAAHVQDTHVAGAGLCHIETVQRVVAQGPAIIRWLQQQGVAFTTQSRADGSVDYHLSREGGHSHRRVVHAADATGRAIQAALEARAQAHPNIQLFAQHNAVDLVTTHKLGLAGHRCVGAYALNRDTHRVETFAARCVVLATGGASRAYLYSSNPDGSTGDGMAMAWRAGCRVANLEFIQFHPTCLYHPQAKSFLITEAVRGEGGQLRLPDGSRFMERFDSRLELAPRDIVARAIDHEMKRLGIPHVYLDISHRSVDFIQSHFPTVYRKCLEYGFDMTKQPLPVVPAAHYTCGGVLTDGWGRTDVENLYAIGEVACTGLHGANRMASNSLLECVAFAHFASEDILRRWQAIAPPLELPDWDESRVTDSDEEVVIRHNWQELRRTMWDYVGIVRTDKRLQRAHRRVDLLLGEIAEYYQHFRISSDLIELRNLAQVAELIIRCAQERKESRGLHYTLDYPQTASLPRDTVLVPAHFAGQAWVPSWS